MAGRHGNDQLNFFLLGVDVVLALLGSLIGGKAGSVLLLLLVANTFYIYFRMLSRKIYKRQEENGKYMRIRYAVLGWLKLCKERWVQRKDYKFYTCASCKTTLRVPRGKGKVNIVCRKCGNSFTGKT